MRAGDGTPFSRSTTCLFRCVLFTVLFGIFVRGKLSLRSRGITSLEQSGTKSPDPLPGTILRQRDKTWSCCGSRQTSTLLSDKILCLLTIARARFLSDTTDCPMVTSKSVCRMTVPNSGSGTIMRMAISWHLSSVIQTTECSGWILVQETELQVLSRGRDLQQSSWGLLVVLIWWWQGEKEVRETKCNYKSIFSFF